MGAARAAQALGVVGVAAVIGYAAASDPAALDGISRGVFWAFVFGLIFYQARWRAGGEAWRSRALVAGLLARGPMVLMHLAVAYLIYGGSGDFHGYFSRTLRGSAALLEGDVAQILSLELSGATEISMEAVARLLIPVYFLVGASIPGMFFISGVVGFVGSYLFLRAFETAFPAAREVRFLAAAVLFFPSLIFWTSLLGKDSWIYLFLGGTAYALAQVLKTARPRHVVGLLVSFLFVTLIRPAVGVVVVVAVGVAFILSLRSTLVLTGPTALLRPVISVVLACLIAGSTVGAIRLMPLYVYGGTGERLAGASLVEGFLSLGVQKHTGLSNDPLAGGSSMAAGIRDTSAASVSWFLPAAMFTFLFRPFPFEAHNALAMVAAVDGSLLLLMVLWRWRHLLAALRAAVRDPFVMFCGVTFLLLTAGLSFESNFGAIVRHRAMVLPFLFLLLAVPRRGKGSALHAPAPEAGGHDAAAVGAARS